MKSGSLWGTLLLFVLVLLEMNYGKKRGRKK